MATKEDGLFFKQKHASVIDSDKSSQFTNLNLNQSHKCLNVSQLDHSFSKSNNDKYCGLTITESSNETRKSWNKSTKNLFLKTSNNLNSNNESTKEEVQRCWKNAKNEGSNKNNSTLSLHIAAYENSFEVSDSSENLPKKSKAFKALPKLQMTQDAFEFPRQMDDSSSNESEVQQFSTSQRLFSPNQGASSSSQMQPPRSSMYQSPNNRAPSVSHGNRGRYTYRGGSRHLNGGSYAGNQRGGGSYAGSQRGGGSYAGSQRGGGSYAGSQRGGDSSFSDQRPVLSHSFNYHTAMLNFHDRLPMPLPAVKSHISEFDFPPVLLKNAEEMKISKLTSCQSLVMTNFFSGQREYDYIIHSPRLSGLTSSVAFCMVKDVFDYKDYDNTKPKDFSPMIIVICENDSGIIKVNNCFTKVANDTKVNVQILRKHNLDENRLKGCDIVISEPFILKDFVEKGKINLSRVRFIYADGADKVFKNFGLISAQNLINHLAKQSPHMPVRILGLEHVYESRRENYFESSRGTLIELRIDKACP